MFTSKKKNSCFLALASAFLASSLFMVPAAQASSPQTKPTPFTTPSTSTNPRDSQDDSWKIVVAPYLWALSMNGTVQIKGQRAHVDQTFSDILNQLNWAGMLFVEANKNKLGIFVNALYASLSDGASDRYISAHVNTNFGLYSGGLSYEVYRIPLCSTGCQSDSSSLAIVPYVGLRYTSNNISLTVNTPIGSLRRSDNQHWINPYLGARLNFDLSKAWLLSLAGDLGGTNTVSDYSYNVMGLIGYKPQTMWTRTTWYLGYRLLDQRYSSGSSSNYFNWNMKIYGPLAGVSFTF